MADDDDFATRPRTNYQELRRAAQPPYNPSGPAPVADPGGSSSGPDAGEAEVMVEGDPGDEDTFDERPQRQAAAPIPLEQSLRRNVFVGRGNELDALGAIPPEQLQTLIPAIIDDETDPATKELIMEQLNQTLENYTAGARAETGRDDGDFPKLSFDEQFGGKVDAPEADRIARGDSVHGREMWAYWWGMLQTKQRYERFAAATRKNREIHYREDMDIGPSAKQDTLRVGSNGFWRNVKNEILWNVWVGDRFRGTSNPNPHFSKLPPSEALRLVPTDLAWKKKFRIEPARVVADRSNAPRPGLLAGQERKPGGKFKLARSALGLPITVYDPETQQMVQQETTVDVLLQRFNAYERDADGRIKRNPDDTPKMVARAMQVPHSAKSARLVMLSIRLNAAHWEWMYSRFLKNREMWDTPSMTPYLHNGEFDRDGNAKFPRSDAHASGPAIPLLTRGTLGFEGVDLNAWSLLGTNVQPALAVQSESDLHNNWTLERLRRLPEVRQSHLLDVNKLQTLAATAKQVALANEPAGTIVRYLFAPDDVSGSSSGRSGPRKQNEDPARAAADAMAGMSESQPPTAGRLGWPTIFVLGTGPYEFYVNAYAADSQAISNVLNVLGYDSWMGGTGAGAILASEKPEDQDKRFRLTFSGLPLFFGGSALAVIDRDKGASSALDLGSGPFYDVRTHSRRFKKRGEDTGYPKIYSEAYRALMWAPMPVRGMLTLPPATDPGVNEPKPFRTTSDPSIKTGEFNAPKFLNLTYNIDQSTIPHVGKDNLKKSKQDWLKDTTDNPRLSHGQNTEAYEDYTHLPYMGTADSITAPLEQHYPEVIIHRKNDMKGRWVQAQKYFQEHHKGSALQMRRDVGSWWPDKPRALYDKAEEDQTDALSETRKNVLEAMNDPSYERQALGPFTLGGAVARYMVDCEDALAGYANKRATEPIETSCKSLQKPGGLYYSCRIDTGKDPGQGGLDTFLPMPMEATLYEIVDQNLARGVHDYVYMEPTDAPKSGEDGYDPGFTDRAGAPAWWTREQALLANNVDKTWRGTNDPWPYDKAIANYNKATSIWTKGVQRDPPWATPAAAHRLDKSSVSVKAGRALYDELELASEPLMEAKERGVFATSQLRRLDTAEAYPELANNGNKGGAGNKKAQLHGALIDKALPAARANNPVDYIGPTTLRIPSGATMESQKVRKENQGFMDQTVMFDASFGQAANNNVDDRRLSAPLKGAKTAVDALPHRHDMRIPRMPIYPTRLSIASREAVWTRTAVLRKHQREGKVPDVIDAKQSRLMYHTLYTTQSDQEDPDKVLDKKWFERPENVNVPDELLQQQTLRSVGFDKMRSDVFMSQSKTTDEQGGDAATTYRRKTQDGSKRESAFYEEGVTSTRTLVIPVYIVALQYDDFVRAVREADTAWTRFFNDHLDYWEHKDRYAVMTRRVLVDGKMETKQYLMPNPEYVDARAENPSRPKGHWETHDGPWLDSDPTVIRTYSAFRSAEDAVVAAKTAGDEEGIAQSTQARVSARSAYAAARTAAEAGVKLARRPAMRMRASWFNDRMQFGSYQPDTPTRKFNPGDDNDATARFKASVVSWTNMYRDFVALQTVYKNALIEDEQVAQYVRKLRKNSLRLCWSLCRLNMVAGRAHDLYKSADDTLCNRREVPKFLLEVLDQIQALQEQLAWLERRHGVLAGTKEALASITARREQDDLQGYSPENFQFIDAMVNMPTPDWPDDETIDSLTASGGKVVVQLLQHLSEQCGDFWKTHIEPKVVGIDQILKMLSSKDKTSMHGLSFAMQIRIRGVLTAWQSYFGDAQPPSEYQYSHEYAIVDTLLAQQSSLLKNTLLYTGVQDYDAQRMYELVVFTAKAFENALYQRTQEVGSVLNSLLEQLLNGTLPASSQATLDALLNEIKSQVDNDATAVGLFGESRFQLVPDDFYRAVELIKEVLQANQGGTRQADAREEQADRALLLWWRNKFSEPRVDYDVNGKPVYRQRGEWKRKALLLHNILNRLKKRRGDLEREEDPDANRQKELDRLEEMINLLQGRLKRIEAAFILIKRAQETNNLSVLRDLKSSISKKRKRKKRKGGDDEGEASDADEQDEDSEEGEEGEGDVAMDVEPDASRAVAGAGTSDVDEELNRARNEYYHSSRVINQREKEIARLRNQSGQEGAEQSLNDAIARLNNVKSQRVEQQNTLLNILDARHRSVAQEIHELVAKITLLKAQGNGDSSEELANAIADLQDAQEELEDLDNEIGDVEQEANRPPESEEDEEVQLQQVLRDTQGLDELPGNAPGILSDQAGPSSASQQGAALENALSLTLSLTPSLPPSPPSPSETSYTVPAQKQLFDKLQRVALEQPSTTITFLASEVLLRLDIWRHDLQQARAQREARRREEQSAIAQVRAYALRDRPDGGKRLAELNAVLRQVPVHGDETMSFSDFRARLRGVGIEDPGACNDNNIDAIDKHELFGWKGAYRMHVANLFRLVPTGGPNNGPYYQLDALPPTPRQWLESDNAVLAAGPPPPPDVQDEDVTLEAASLDKATASISKTAAMTEPVKEALKRLLEADRAHALDNPKTAWYMPWAFDFAPNRPSSAVPQDA